MGCFVWKMAKLSGQADELGRDHFQLYVNQVDVRKLGQKFNEKRRRKPKCTKTGAYEDRGLSVYISRDYCGCVFTGNMFA